MRVALSGPIDGAIKEFYDKLPEVPWALCTGDFGVWPDPAKIDRATRRKGGAQDFAYLYLHGFQAPVPTIFVSGTHEDHRWLEQRKGIPEGMEILGEVNWLMNGYKTHIGGHFDTLRVTGLGKVYSEATFNGKFNRKSYRHYTRRELEKGCASGPTDILLLHEAPAKPIKNLIYATRPKLIVHSDRTYRKYSILDVPTIALPKHTIKIVEYQNEAFKVQ